MQIHINPLYYLKKIYYSYFLAVFGQTTSSSLLLLLLLHSTGLVLFLCQKDMDLNNILNTPVLLLFSSGCCATSAAHEAQGREAAPGGNADQPSL